MKVLFVCSGSNGVPGTVVGEQGRSVGGRVVLSWFIIGRRGLFGYISMTLRLRRLLRKESYDIIHAHYGYSAISATIAGAKPLVVSLMGSDLSSIGFGTMMVRFFAKRVWRHIIVKSDQMRSLIGRGDIQVIPNGIDMNLFRPISKADARKRLGWNMDKSVVLFAADPAREEKNYGLFRRAVETEGSGNIEEVVLGRVPHYDMPLYYNASDVIVLTSRREGSPNVIKEAMACGRPVVTTATGDTEWLLGHTAGCYIVEGNPEDIAGKLSEALMFSHKEGTTEGRSRMEALSLDSESVALRLTELYSTVRE